MPSSRPQCPRGTLFDRLLLVSLLAITTAADTFDGYVNKYCSSENTGSTYQAVYNTYASMGSCATNCNDGGYAFAILQYKDCWCSNYVPAVTVSTSSCSESCPGYPQDQCGNQAKGLYGYVALNGVVLGTQGVSTKNPPPTPTPPPSPVGPITLTQTEQQTVLQTVTAVRTPTPSVEVSLVTPTPSPASSSPSSSPVSSTFFTTTVSSNPTTTISLAPTTYTVTPTPSTISPIHGGGSTSIEKHGLSGGATAGIVVGTLIGAAAVIIAGIFFWRRRNQDDTSDSGSNRSTVHRSPKRKGSVLSKTGLLGVANRPQSMSQAMSQAPYDDPFVDGNVTRTNSIRHSMMFGAAGGSADGTHLSGPANTGSNDAGSERRSSRPLVYDQRLNPSALFANHDNGSRVSMQDQQDYSRPLGVANPDFRYSFDSR